MSEINDLANEIAAKNYGRDYTVVELCAIHDGIVIGLQMAAQVCILEAARNEVRMLSRPDSEAYSLDSEMYSTAASTAKRIRDVILGLEDK